MLIQSHIVSNINGGCALWDGMRTVIDRALNIWIQDLCYITVCQRLFIFMKHYVIGICFGYHNRNQSISTCKLLRDTFKCPTVGSNDYKMCSQRPRSKVLYSAVHQHQICRCTMVGMLTVLACRIEVWWSGITSAGVKRLSRIYRLCKLMTWKLVSELHSSREVVDTDD